MNAPTSLAFSVGKDGVPEAEPDLAGPRTPLLPTSLLLLPGHSPHVECASHFLECSGYTAVHKCRPGPWDIPWSPALHVTTLPAEHGDPARGLCPLTHLQRPPRRPE